MADLNYTKGKWKVEGTNIIRAGGRRGLYTIARAYDPDNSPLQTPIALANARLIAAAPDMYEALRDVQAGIDHWTLRKRIDLALAKAEGKVGL